MYATMIITSCVIFTCSMNFFKGESNTLRGKRRNRWKKKIWKQLDFVFKEQNMLQDLAFKMSKVTLILKISDSDRFF